MAVTEMHLENPDTPGDGPRFRCHEDDIVNTSEGFLSAKDVVVGSLMKRNARSMPLKVLAVITPAPG